MCLISSMSWITAITFICEPHVGQTSGSTSYTRASNRAQALLRAVESTSSESDNGATRLVVRKLINQLPSGATEMELQ